VEFIGKNNGNQCLNGRWNEKISTIQMAKKIYNLEKRV
jgi:hypothetical protein